MRGDTEGPSSARVNLSIPAELLAEVRERRPGLNLSEVLRSALGQQLQLCSHGDLRCVCCHEELDRVAMVDQALGGFYDALHEAVSELVHTGDGTAEGAARIMDAVARRWGVSMAERRPVPRPTRRARRDALERKLELIDAPPAARARARVRRERAEVERERRREVG